MTVRRAVYLTIMLAAAFALEYRWNDGLTLLAATEEVTITDPLSPVLDIAGSCWFGGQKQRVTSD